MDIWLPKDERKLLKYYYGEEKERGETLRFPMHKLAEVLGFKGNNESALKAGEYPNRVLNTNIDLKDRGLINYFSYEHPKIDVKLTRKGRDLGRKYSSKWIRSGLWFAEYKHHWIWLIVSFLGGIIGALLVNWLSNGD
jgi:hypothetical protein